MSYVVLWAQRDGGIKADRYRFTEGGELPHLETSMSHGHDARRAMGNLSGTETAHEGGNHLTKFLARRDRTLATVVLAVDLSLLHLIDDPDDPVNAWTTLQNQFQKKTLANKLALRRRLHSLQLRDGESVQDHIKAMTELFNELARPIVGDAIEEED